eukprot:scaffold3811_cov116-Isochrysis_galbana.AAC.2
MCLGVGGGRWWVGRVYISIGWRKGGCNARATDHAACGCDGWRWRGPRGRRCNDTRVGCCYQPPPHPGEGAKLTFRL